MDHAIAARLRQGGSVIVPSPAAAARLRIAYAHQRVAQGAGTWESPDILTWEAWLAREWQRNLAPGHAAAPLRVLNGAQELQLWKQALQDLSPRFADHAPLQQHAAALRHAAHQARQYLFRAPRAPLTTEESLLWHALARVEQLAGDAGSVALGLATPTLLAALRTPAPAIAGVPRLTPLQAQLGRQLWPGETLLLAPDPALAATQTCWRARDTETECAAVADWCRRQLQAEPHARLRIIQCNAGASLGELATRIWRTIAADTTDALQPWQAGGWLAVEQATPLLAEPLVEQALAMLGLLLQPVPMAQVSRLLLGPWFDWGAQDPATLALRLCEMERADWDLPVLLQALQLLETEHAAAPACAQRLQAAAAELQPGTGSRPAGYWAAAFDRALAVLGFPGRRDPDVTDMRSHAHWRSLLDEFASLDALGLHFTANTAWQELSALAGHALLQAPTTDAAITLSADCTDPMVGYDGIWVMGMTEGTIPAPVRPDSFTDLAAQRAAGWPGASAALQFEQAKQDLAGWRRRAGQLVCSYAALDGDLPCAASRLLPGPWQPLPAPVAAAQDGMPECEAVVDARLSPLTLAAGERLRQAGTRLTLQQACPFRSQAQLRLGAARLETPVEGIDPRRRGQLLHAALDGLWQALQDSTGLQALDDEALAAAIRQHWQRAEQRVLADMAFAPPQRALARERRRGIALLQDLMRWEAQRPVFSVVARETHLLARIDGTEMALRVDRIDRLGDGQRLLIDYKSGQPGPVSMESPPAHPLQLALYATALAGSGQAVQALALLHLTAGEVRPRGVADQALAGLGGIKALADWKDSAQQWAQEISRLLAAHLAGEAAVTPEKGACRSCHLQALCRIHEVQPAQDTEADDE